MLSGTRTALQLQVREVGVINGFCYAYTKLLLDKAEVLMATSEILERKPNEGPHLTDVANMIFIALADQTQCKTLSSYAPLEEIADVVRSVKQFLAIFDSQ